MDKLKVWKHEQQQMANGIPKTHFVSLDRLQLWCEELAELIWKTYEQLKEVEHILVNGIIQTGNAADLKFVQARTDEVLRLLQELLNHSLIVEEQPPQIIKMKTKFPKPVIVSMLVGKRLNIHMNRPELTARIISEDQAKALPVTDKLETIGEITNGKVPIDNSKDDFKRLTFPFRSLQLKTIKRTDRRGSNSNERVMEEKSCLYFECLVTVGPVKFKVMTSFNTCLYSIDIVLLTFCKTNVMNFVLYELTYRYRLYLFLLLLSVMEVRRRWQWLQFLGITPLVKLVEYLLQFLILLHGKM